MARALARIALLLLVSAQLASCAKKPKGTLPEITTDSWADEVGGARSTIVEFYAPWCEACHARPCGGRSAAVRPRVQPQLMFEVGVSHTASARSVDSERRRPSDGRLRRERAGADGQQCERDRAHRVLRLAGQSSNGGASGSLLGRTQGARHFTPAKRRLPAAWLEPLSSRYQK